MNSKAFADFRMEGIRGFLVTAIEGPKVDGILVLVRPVPAELWLALHVVQDGPPVVHEVAGFRGVVGLHHEGQVSIGALKTHFMPHAKKGLYISKDALTVIGPFALSLGLWGETVDGEVNGSKAVRVALRCIRERNKQS